MNRPDRDRLLAVLGTAGLAAVLAGLVWLGLHTGDLAAGPLPSGAPGATSTPTPNPAPAPAPTGTAAAGAPSPPSGPTTAAAEPAVAAAFAEESARLGGDYSLVWVDSAGVHVLGPAPASPAWSTIKVPLAIAALEADSATATRSQVEAALTRSDNAAADALWVALGPPETAAEAVDEVLAGLGSAGTHTQPQRVTPPFSPYGQTVWSVPDAARFAAALACTPGASPAGEVRQVMADVVADQRWGIGQLDAAHFKGGWGPEAGGAYVLRQLGDARVGDERFALALWARAGDGQYARGADDLSALVRWWAASVAPGRVGLSCAG